MQGGPEPSLQTFGTPQSLYSIGSILYDVTTHVTATADSGIAVTVSACTFFRNFAVSVPRFIALFPVPLT